MPSKSQVDNSQHYEEILTLEEAAAYLRVSEGALRAMVGEDAIPTQKIGGEWRFLKRAINEWLCNGGKPGSKEAVLKHFGIFRDDDDMEERLAEIRAKREATG